MDHLGAFIRDADAFAKILVPESNEKMKDSYLILDEHARFLNCTVGGKQPGRSLLHVTVEEPVAQVH